MIPKIYKLNSFDAKNNFKIHVSKAGFIVKIAATLGELNSRIFWGIFTRLPILSALTNSTNSLIRMHNLAANRGLKLFFFGDTFRFNCQINELFPEKKTFSLIIIGSGPGGSIVAAKAIRNNLDFLLIEKGEKFDEKIPSHSVEQMAKHFRYGAQEVILSWPPIPFAQGETLGGGSAINSGLYHRLPESIRESWKILLGPKSSNFEEAENKVFDQLNIKQQDAEKLGIYKNSPILKMQEVLGWKGSVVPRWRSYADAANYTHNGMNETYLRDIPKDRLLLNHEVVKLKTKKSQTEVVIKGENCKHIFLAEKICLSAGTVSSPEILVRSKLAKPRDFKFSFHAMIRELGEYDFEVNDLVDIDPHQIWPSDQSLKIGAAVGTPELLEATLASKGVTQDKDIRKIGSFYISLPSEGRSGLIKFGRDLIPYFFPSKSMNKKIRDASELLKKAITATGGSVLGGENLSISTVHIFGTIPLQNSKIIDQLGFVKKSQNRIFIRDASLIPSHPLVNPQGPLMHLVTCLEED